MNSEKACRTHQGMKAHGTLAMCLCLTVFISVFLHVLAERQSYASYDRSPTIADDLNSEGIRLAESGKHQEAITLFDNALEAETNDTNDTKIISQIWYNKGLSYEKLEQFENAVDSFDKAAIYDPTYVQAWISKAMDLEELKRYGESEVALDKALELEPNNILAQIMKNSTEESMTGNSSTG
jgi:tetratricopeptide (TPR) repeat protein